MPLNAKVEKEILKNRKWGSFLLPDYERYCLSNVPDVVKNILSGSKSDTKVPKKMYEKYSRGSEKIVMFLFDGFGYYQWKKYFPKLEFFDNITRNGTVIPLTTIFPSTTAAAMNTISTGLTPNRHGLLEWNVYFKNLDMILSTLPFSPVKQDDVRRFERNANPKILLNSKTIYNSLKQDKVKSFTFVYSMYAISPYSRLAYSGSTLVPYDSIADLAMKLGILLESTKGKSYFYVYIDAIDHVAHQFGPHTPEYRTQLEMISYILQKGFLERMTKEASSNVTLMASSDHGQINVVPEKTIYLNNYKKFVGNLRRSRNGRVIMPTGSSRDLFVHLKKGSIGDTKEFLEKKIGSRAKIIETKEALKMNLFGPGKATKDFVDRIGDLLILPLKNNLVWYEYVKGMKFKSLGHHGGLSKDEMMTELAVARMKDLI